MAYRADNKCERCECLVVPRDAIDSIIDSIICQNCWTKEDELNYLSGRNEWQIFSNAMFINRKFN